MTHLITPVPYRLYVLTSPAENDLKVALNMLACSACKKRSCWSLYIMPIDSNGIWNVIRNVFSIFFTFVWNEVCINKVYFWWNKKCPECDGAEAEEDIVDFERSWSFCCFFWFSATSEPVERAKELESKCTQKKSEKIEMRKKINKKICNSDLVIVFVQSLAFIVIMTESARACAKSRT